MFSFSVVVHFTPKQLLKHSAQHTAQMQCRSTR
uniref:Uncharacterized protein n=1 Tax=Anguilla anguilla TaxID=7936 RepID=A0A0E9TQM2_ANGAN